MLRCVKIVIFILVLILFSVPTLSNPTDKLNEDLKSAYDLVPEMFYEISGKGFDKDVDFNDYLSDLNIIKIFMDLLTESFFKYKNEYLSFIFIPSIERPRKSKNAAIRWLNSDKELNENLIICWLTVSGAII